MQSRRIIRTIVIALWAWAAAASPAVAQGVGAVAARGDTRLPAVRSADVTVRRTFRYGSKTVEPRLDLFNLTNRATILARTTQLGRPMARRAVSSAAR